MISDNEKSLEEKRAANRKYLEEQRIKIIKIDKEIAMIIANSLIKDISSIKSNVISNIELHKYLYLLHLDQVVRIGNLAFTSAVFEAWWCGPVIPEIYYKYIKYKSNPLPYDSSMPDIEYGLNSSDHFKLRAKCYYEFIDYIVKADYNKISRLILIDMKYKEIYNKNIGRVIVDIDQDIIDYSYAIWRDALNYNRILYDNDIYYNKTNFEVNREKL